MPFCGRRLVVHLDSGLVLEKTTAQSAPDMQPGMNGDFDHRTAGHLRSLITSSILSLVRSRDNTLNFVLPRYSGSFFVPCRPQAGSAGLSRHLFFFLSETLTKPLFVCIAV